MQKTTSSLHGFSHLIFDFDETLATLIIDWTDWHDGVKEIVRRHDPHFSHEGKITPGQINSFYEIHGEKIRQDLLAFNEEFETQHVRGIKHHPRALKTLRNLGNNKKTHLLTSNSKKTIIPFLEELEIRHLFTNIITRDDVQKIKPDPHPFSLIRVDTIPLSEYVMIGDSEADRGFARSAGISFVHVDEL